MAVILAILAASLSLPEIDARQARKLDASYPAWAVRSEQSSGFDFEVIVDSTGRVLECRIVAFAGSEKLARDYCAHAAKLKFKPATDSSGTAMAGVLRSSIVMSLDGPGGQAEEARAFRATPDLQFTVEPDVAKQMEGWYVPVAVQIDAHDRITSCAVISNSDRPVLSEQFKQMACSQIMTLGLRRPPTLPPSTPYVSTVRVGLVG